MRLTGLGTIFLAVYLLLTGLSGLVGLRFDGLPVVQGVLAVVAGALLLLRR